LLLRRGETPILLSNTNAFGATAPSAYHPAWHTTPGCQLAGFDLRLRRERLPPPRPQGKARHPPRILCLSLPGKRLAFSLGLQTPILPWLFES
jgi:hypothetical protein